MKKLLAAALFSFISFTRPALATSLRVEECPASRRVDLENEEDLKKLLQSTATVGVYEVLQSDLFVPPSGIGGLYYEKLVLKPLEVFSRQDSDNKNAELKIRKERFGKVGQSELEAGRKYLLVLYHARQGRMPILGCPPDQVLENGRAQKTIQMLRELKKASQ